MTHSKPLVLAIAGTTASGKTSLSLELASALSGELILCDSMQIYRGLDIGTAKPSLEEQARVPHHLLDCQEPGDFYSVADYVRDATLAIDDCLQRGKTPILVGGTMQYLTALVEHIQYEAEDDKALLQAIQERFRPLEPQLAHDFLATFDFEAAEHIHPNNRKRVYRAIQQAILHGQSKAERELASKREESPYSWLVFALNWERSLLYDRIHQRVHQMMEDGLLEEARAVKAMKLPEQSTCMQAIAYKEFWPYLEGKATLEEAIECLKKNTRHYAKRQLTWLRSKAWIQFLDGQLGSTALCKEILRRVKAHHNSVN